MYSWSFLCEEVKIKQRTFSQKNFVKSVRKQYGNPDSHPIFKSPVFSIWRYKVKKKDEILGIFLSTHRFISESFAIFKLEIWIG